MLSHNVFQNSVSGDVFIEERGYSAVRVFGTLHDTQKMQSQVTGKRKALYPFLKRVERRTLETPNLSSRLPSIPGRIMDQILLGAVLGHVEDREVI